MQAETDAVVVYNRSHEAIRFNFVTGKIIQRARVGEFPYAVKTLPAGRLAISNWGHASVTILDGERLRTLRTVPVGNHPSALTPISCRRLTSFRCERFGALRSRFRTRACDPARGKLFVALAAVNALHRAGKGPKKRGGSSVPETALEAALAKDEPGSVPQIARAGRPVVIQADCGKVSGASPDHGPIAADWTRTLGFGSPLLRSSRLLIRGKPQLINSTSFPRFTHEIVLTLRPELQIRP